MNTKEALMKILHEMEKKYPDMTPETRAEMMATVLVHAKVLLEKQYKQQPKV